MTLGMQMCAPIIGLLSGAIFFGGLWWTVRAGIAARRPAIWFPISLALRASLLSAGFLYVGAQGREAVLSCIAGVLIARTATIRLASCADLRSDAA